MRHARALLALVSAVFLCNVDVQAQAPQRISDGNPALVDISVAPANKLSEASTNIKVRISITNKSTLVLVHTYPIERGSVQLEVRGPDGIIPPETESGCKRHMSTKCGPSVRLGAPVSFTALIVMPGQTISFDQDVAAEYRLDATPTVSIDILANDFVLVDAPPAVREAPLEVRRGYLLDYKRYNYSKLPPLHSNSITFQCERSS